MINGQYSSGPGVSMDFTYRYVECFIFMRVFDKYKNLISLATIAFELELKSAVFIASHTSDAHIWTRRSYGRIAARGRTWAAVLSGLATSLRDQSISSESGRVVIQDGVN